MVERFRADRLNGLPPEIVTARATRLAELAVQRADRTGNRKLAKSEDYFRTQQATRRVSTTTINKQLTLLAIVFNYAR